MTTWDLFRLLRNTESLAWPLEHVRAVFYRSGRVEPVPDHYTEIGTIVKTWDPAFGLIPAEAVSVGDRLAVQSGDTFEELAVTSLQVDAQPLTSAPAGSNCGIAYPGASTKFREGARVFRVGPPTSATPSPPPETPQSTP